MGETVSGAVKQDPSQLTPTSVGTRDVTSSQEGSQSVPQPGLSPVLAQYKSYLQSCYKARALAPADKYLPTLQAPYLNLAMIKRGHHGRDARDEFTRRTLHGGVDQILAIKTPINIEDLLVPERRHGDASSSVRVSCSGINPSPFSRVQLFLHSIGLLTSPPPKMAGGRGSEQELKPVRFILVEGPPGIGKSTFAWEVCRRWDEIESLRSYHTVMLLKLREKWVLNATKLSDLFRYPSEPKKSTNIAKDLSHHTVGIEDCKVLLRSLYEAQNEDIIPHYFTAETKRRQVTIVSLYSDSLSTPYECYALSYCLAHSLDHFSFNIHISCDDEVSFVEIFVKGLEDHCTSTTPSVERLRVRLETESEEISHTTMFWLMKAKFMPALEKLYFDCIVVNSNLTLALLQSLVKLQSLVIDVGHTSSLEWLAGLKSLSELRESNISIRGECSPPPAGLECGPVSSRLKRVKMDINLPSNTAYDLHSSTDGMVDSLLKSVLRSNQITELCLPNISRETMAGVHSILLHCPSLVSLELKRTRLGYDGILYICSALKNNTSLTHLLIHDDPQVPASRERECGNFQFTSFSSTERVALPDKTTCTDFILELNNILKDNTTLEEMGIQSGLFLPLSAGGHREYHQWTGLGPLQQFNVGAVGSGRSPNLRISFSSSDLTQPQTLLFWDQQLNTAYDRPAEVDFKRLFSKRKEGKKLFSLPSFTSPDTEVLQSFSGLDPRLKQCLRISQLNEEYVAELWRTYWDMLRDISRYMQLY